MNSTSNQDLTFSAGLAGQAIAGLGALLCLLFSFGMALPAAGVAMLVVGVIIASPQGRFPGPFMVEWWTVLTFASLAALGGFALGFALTVPGNILLALGAVVALIAVGLGSPAETE